MTVGLYAVRANEQINWGRKVNKIVSKECTLSIRGMFSAARGTPPFPLHASSLRHPQLSAFDREGAADSVSHLL